ncbi:hypothetical protein N7507_004578 [Penicillium longicatenatum]|nr:hypothetical protein N7507_004578 [Penicillium longicatenatum]
MVETSSLSEHDEKSVVLDEKSSPDVAPQNVNAALERSVTTESAKYPSLKKIIPIMAALYISMFLVALDRLIVATATPKITDEFHSLTDIGWYGSAYMLTASASQLVYGRIYTFYPAKWVFLGSILVFEIGSALCGAAPSSIAFIIGRAVAGLGTGGISAGAVIIIVFTIPLEKRPMYQGFLGAVFGIASVLGPILGGVFTTNVTWRWCFYINLPFGGVAIAAIFLLLDVPPPKNGNWTIKQKIAQLDPLVGGSTYAWSNWRIIFLFILFGVLGAVFVVVEIKLGERALVPPRIFTQRSVLAGFFWTMSTSACMMVMLYYIPIWFQAIKNVDAEQSGIMNLPLVLAMVIGVISSGIAISKFGYYNPFMFAAVVLLSVGAGLLYTFQADTGHPKWIGYQVIFGLGLGLGIQQATIAVQTCLAPVDVPVGASLLMFSQQLNGALFVGIAETLFSNFLKQNLEQVSGINAAEVIKAGATAIRQYVPASKLSEVLSGYSDAITKTFILGIVMSVLSLFPALAMEWKSVKKDVHKEKKQETAEEKA